MSEKKEKEFKKRADKEFCVVDPYNPENTIEGTIYRHNEKYGDLFIKKVNGKDCEQYIHTTPKFYYPGNVGSPRKYEEGKFPPFKIIRMYDKLDGTNIFMFRYRDAEGNSFRTFKTRLVPVLNKNGFKDWITLWNRAIKPYEDNLNALVESEFNYGFEMYGGINEILIKYDVALDTKLLYAIKEDGRIVDPVDFDFPIPKVVKEFESDENPDEVYKSYEIMLEKMFTSGEQVEGCMLYIHSESGDVIPWKCKPPSVLDAQSEENKKYIGVADAYTTAMNAAESISSIKELKKETYLLLAEVYEEMKIERSKPQIEKALEKAHSYLMLQKKVMDEFKKLGVEWDESKKKEIMPRLMENFPRKMSAVVYGMVKKYSEAFSR